MSGNISKKKWGTGEASVNGKTLYTLSVSDIDKFYDGIGIVTEDIFSGNLVTGVKKWILFASYDVQNNISFDVTQTRYYNNYWQKRTGSYYQYGVNWTSAWQPWENIESVDFSEYAKKADTLEGYGINNAYSKDESDKKFLTKDSLEQISSFVTTEELNQKLSSVYKYKGTVNHYTDLPKTAEIGDVYNIKAGYKLSKMLYPIQLVSVDGEPYEYVGVSILSCSSATILPEMVNCDVLLYDSKRKNIPWNGRILSETTIEAFMDPDDFSPGIYYIEITNADFSQYYKEITFVEITAGDNVAWTGTDWDVLSGTIDTSNFATKEEVNILNSKLTSVYRYKGTVSHFSNLPSSPEVGDVYNIENGYHLSKEVKPITVTDAYTDEDYAYIFVDPGTSMPPWAFNIDGINICDKNLNVISVAAITDLNLMRCEKDAAIEIGKQYYLEYFNITIEDLIYETGIVTVSVDINAGDNVAWTGTEWDRLAGTVDLSNYATKEDIEDIKTTLAYIKELQNSYIGGDNV